MAKSDQELMSGIVADIARAKALGLVPEEGSKVSRRGEFIVNPSNIDLDEEKKMRGYRPKPFPTSVRRWGVDLMNGQPGVEEVVVEDAAALKAAEAAGWTTEWVTGPPVIADEAPDGGLEVDIPTPARRRRAVN